MFRFIGLCLGTLVGLLRGASGRPTRESRATSTTRSPETSASEANARFARQALLGRRPPILVRMATIPHCGHAGNRGALAQGRIPFVLEADLQGQEARRATADIEGSSGIDLPNEDRTHLGLGKGTPDGRPRTIASGRVLFHVRLGGLHHPYDQAA